MSPDEAVARMNANFTYCHYWGSEPAIAHRQPDGRLTNPNYG